jgi:methyl-accepting chemotaxis protein
VKLQTKLPAAMAGVMLLLLLGGLFGIHQLRGSLSEYDVGVRSLVVVERKVSALESKFASAVQAWKNILLRGKDPARLKQYEDEFKKNIQEVVAGAKALESDLHIGETKALMAKTVAALQPASDKYASALAAFKAAEFDPSAGDKAASGADRDVAKLLREASEVSSKHAAEIADRVNAGARTNTITSITAMVIALFLGLVGGMLLVRSITRQLGADPQVAADLAGDIAAGNLSTPIRLLPGDTTSLLAQLKRMQESLTTLVGDVRESAQAVSGATVEIADGNQQISQRAEQQTATLEETAASMEELGAAVTQNAERTKLSNQLAANASLIAIKGGAVVGQVVETMKGINDSSRKISDIISVIDGIAFQTNILALNAAVEAARAGEQGRGFAVVASEVRSLAGRSAEAAKEIKALISASVTRVEQGTAQVDEAGATMTEVVNAIKQVTDIMGEISAASLEQSAGVAQMGEAVAQLDKTTQQNTALVEGMAAAASALTAQAQDLVQSVSVFQLGSSARQSANSWTRALPKSGLGGRLALST